MWFVHCLTKNLETKLIPILNGMPIRIVNTSIEGVDTYVKLEATRDIVDILFDAGFHVSEA